MVVGEVVGVVVRDGVVVITTKELLVVVVNGFELVVVTTFVLVTVVVTGFVVVVVGMVQTLFEVEVAVTELETLETPPEGLPKHPVPVHFKSKKFKTVSASVWILCPTPAALIAWNFSP